MELPPQAELRRMIAAFLRRLMGGHAGIHALAINRLAIRPGAREQSPTIIAMHKREKRDAARSGPR